MEFTLKLNRLFSDLIRASSLITAGLARFAQPSFLSIKFTGDTCPIFSDIVNTEDESLPVNSLPFGEQAGSIVKLRGSRIVCGSLDTCKRCSLSLFFLRTVSFSFSPSWRCSPSTYAATLLLQCLQSFFLRLLFGRLESVWSAVDRARDERASSTKVFHATSVSSRHPLFLFRFVTRTEELVDGSRPALRRNGSVELRSKTPAISSRLSNDLVDVPRPPDTKDRWARFSFETRDGVRVEISSVPGKISSYTWVSSFEISRDCCSSSKPWFSIYVREKEKSTRLEWFVIFFWRSVSIDSLYINYRWYPRLNIVNYSINFFLPRKREQQRLIYRFLDRMWVEETLEILTTTDSTFFIIVKLMDIATNCIPSIITWIKDLIIIDRDRFRIQMFLSSK